MIGQILMDGTKLTAPRILVIFVVTGVVLQALDLYQPLVDLAGNGATARSLPINVASASPLLSRAH